MGTETKETSDKEDGTTPEKSKTPTPYDAFFKAAFSESESAADLIRNFLPEAYSRRIEEAEISADIKDYINRELTEHHSDLLVTCRSAESEFHFYFLFEHKSSPERSTLLILARAIIELTFDLLGKEKEAEEEDKPTAAEEEDEKRSNTPDSGSTTDEQSSHKNRGKKPPPGLPSEKVKAGGKWLPEIIPVILYHGDPPWNYPMQFSEHIDSMEENARHLLSFEPFFIRLQSYRDEQFTGSLKTVVGLMVLKYLSHRLDEEAARSLVETMKKADPVPLYLREFYDKCYRVLFQLKEAEEYELLLGEMDKSGYTEEKERAMTYEEVAEKRGIEKGIERGIERGIEKGKEEGRVEGEHNTLIRQLDRKFGLSEEEKELIRRTEELEKIEAALDEFVFAETKEQVLTQLKK